MLFDLLHSLCSKGSDDVATTATVSSRRTQPDSFSGSCSWTFIFMPYTITRLYSVRRVAGLRAFKPSMAPGISCCTCRSLERFSTPHAKQLFKLRLQDTLSHFYVLLFSVIQPLCCGQRGSTFWDGVVELPTVSLRFCSNMYIYMVSS